MEEKLQSLFDVNPKVLDCQNNCGLELSIETLTEHKKICPERNYICLFGCNFISKKNNFLQHLINFHSNHILTICDNIAKDSLTITPLNDKHNNIHEYRISDFTKCESANDDSIIEFEKNNMYIDSDLEDSF